MLAIPVGFIILIYYLVKKLMDHYFDRKNGTGR